MTEEFNLSDKIEHEDPDEYKIRIGDYEYLLKEDVKEFIRRLKYDVNQQWQKWLKDSNENGFSDTDIFDLIDKLAGDKLI